MHQRSDKYLEDLARMCNPVMRGWINYFKSYCKSAMRPTLDLLDPVGKEEIQEAEETPAKSMSMA